MKEIKHTPQGFSYVDVTLHEVINWGGLGICDGCNRGPFENLKLIYILHDTYCENCFNEWLKRANSYLKEDIEYDLNIQKDNDEKWYKAYLMR